MELGVEPVEIDSPEYGHVFSGKRMDSGCDSPFAKKHRA